MQDYPTISRMASAAVSPEADAFEPGEAAGLRTAGWILVTTALLGVLGSLLQPGHPLPPWPRARLASVLDLLLGLQLLRLGHTWRVAVLFRAWAELFLALVMVGAATAEGGRAGVAVSAGQAAYAGALLLLLLGMPTPKRVLAGRVVFALSVVLTVAAIVWSGGDAAQARVSAR